MREEEWRELPWSMSAITSGSTNVSPVMSTSTVAAFRRRLQQASMTIDQIQGKARFFFGGVALEETPRHNEKCIQHFRNPPALFLGFASDQSPRAVSCTAVSLGASLVKADL
ncbi:hypothetical protein CBOM_04733 [Ceraceosorus bombacis]|uniref:Uncharacterized protein n=1 Tax=Ceraceosorus bombacis TaxID=401625 RepID=A0A0P1BP75_9BASI|nr:hypothetical protein CBOM_04733 [Ceraceosorus bombacis]